MEPQTRFNLDDSVAAWREELAQHPGLNAVDARELETHLRDGFAELKRNQLTDEEAFLIARRRVGSPVAVADEFAKTSPARLWSSRVFWMVFGVLSLSLWQTTFGLWWAVATGDSGGFLAINLPYGERAVGEVLFLFCVLATGLAGLWFFNGCFTGIFRQTISRRWILGMAVTTGILVTLSLQNYAIYILDSFYSKKSAYLDTHGLHVSNLFSRIYGVVGILENNVAFEAFLFLCMLGLVLWPRLRRAGTKRMRAA
ncbi:MAG TPA: permease prefix domain 1-containing protein [Opitutales bacterium]|jgi:hypothetical protein|nr:permease prefix domain 1-containing protein [Opitutales bacterium]